jgi:glutaredoxin-like protein
MATSAMSMAMLMNRRERRTDMSLLTEKDAKVVGERLAKLAGPVTIVMFTQEMECDYCRQTRELVEELAGLSGGKLVVEVLDFVRDKARAEAMGIDKIPALAVTGPGGRDAGIRFYGIPAGYEFASLMESIDLVSRGDSGLSPSTREKLASLKTPLDLKVFVTPTCPYCPRAVMTAFRFAMESKNVTASMVEATEFPQLANKYGVSGVPHTVIGESPQPMVGAYPEAAAADMVVAASKGMLSM